MTQDGFDFKAVGLESTNKHACLDVTMAIERARVVAIYANQGLGINYFTCDGCIEKYECPYVYDSYNVDGDCLAMK